VSSTASTESRSRRRVAVFGSTGSIGRNALDVARHHADRIEIHGLAANSRWAELAEQCHEFRPRYALIADADAIGKVDRGRFPSETTLLFGTDGVMRLATDPDVELVVSAVVGAAGLMGTWAAIETGKTIALANKETLVVAGSLVMELAARRGVTILPVDSEHSAIRQAMTGHRAADVEKIILTASGGPFRGKTTAELANVSIEDALRHPTWQMGPKITVDSATMMNKALEVIEARWLFGLRPEQIDVIVHPASIVHSFVEFVDGSVLAQLSPPDMRLPIQLAMLHPDRLPGPAKKLDWRSFAELRFEPADRGTFPAIDLGFEVARRGGTTGAVLNAANEAAVARFLAGELKFLDIARCCRAVLDSHDYDPSPTLAGLLAADRRARQEVSRWTSP
jgi:1-deoxy-D-xylulose-5-phosphate reductoisomerase